MRQKSIGLLLVVGEILVFVDIQKSSVSPDLGEQQHDRADAYLPHDREQRPLVEAEEILTSRQQDLPGDHLVDRSPR